MAYQSDERRDSGPGHDGWTCEFCGHRNYDSGTCELCELDPDGSVPEEDDYDPDGWDEEDGDEPPEVPDLEVRNG